MGSLAGYRLAGGLADTVYWINTGDNTIRGAPLAGGGTVDTLYDSAHGVDLALGIAINPAAGRIHWTNYGDSTIRGAPLAGGGTVDTLYDSAQGVTDPVKMSIDPAAGRLYWTGNYGNGEIRRAPLAGGGTVNTLYGPAQGVFAPTGMAIDPAAGRVYWSDSGYGTILGAPLAGGGAVDTLYGPAPGGAWGPPVYGPTGVAIDPAAGRIYWANYADGTIRGAPVAGGTVKTLYGPGQGVIHPAAVAIDPTSPTGPATIDRSPSSGWLKWAPEWAEELLSRFFPTRSPPGRIYWPNADDTIRAAPLAGGGTVDTLYGSAQGVSSPSAIAVLRAPLGTVPPVVSWSLMLPDDLFGGLGYGGSHSGPLDQRLSCSRGMWAPDLLGSYLYRAPQSFAYQWRLNGTDIGGATAANYTPTTPGSYTCRVTATNRAGSATQTSAAVTTV
jgi:DNA-binding beta-propeller fold protein YncE